MHGPRALTPFLPHRAAHYEAAPRISITDPQAAPYAPNSSRAATRAQARAELAGRGLAAAFAEIEAARRRALLELCALPEELLR